MQALQRNGALMASRLGVELKLAKVVVRNPAKARAVKIPRGLLTADWRSVVADPQIDLFAELIGGTTTARAVVLAALKRGKPVVTANKALLSAHGEELFRSGAKASAQIFITKPASPAEFRSSKSCAKGLIGNRITRLYGIVNGTCNYILTRMKARRRGFADVLADAQRTRLCGGRTVAGCRWSRCRAQDRHPGIAGPRFLGEPKQIHVEGIRQITRLDIQFAGQLGYTIKLLGIVKKLRDGRERSKAKGDGDGCPIQVSVYPTLVPNIARAGECQPCVQCDLCSRRRCRRHTLLRTRGRPGCTASAVLSDLADAALDLKWARRVASRLSFRTSAKAQCCRSMRWSRAIISARA